MSKVKKLTSYFKMVTKELFATQLSRNSRKSSLESAKNLSTLSSAVMSIIDLTDFSSSDLISPALNAIADYESDNVREPEGEVKFIGNNSNKYKSKLITIECWLVRL